MQPVCATGAIAGDIVVLAVNGRKTTLGQLAAGAGIGCTGGIAVLGAYAAGAAIAASYTAQAVGATTILTALTMREALLRAAQHPQLRNAISELYRHGAKIGDGGTAAAIRYDVQQGLRWIQTGHGEKAINYGKNLSALIQKGVLNASDSTLARIILNDLRDSRIAK